MRRAATLAIALAGLAFAGCGGSSSGNTNTSSTTSSIPGVSSATISKTTLVKKGDQLCTQTVAHRTAVPKLSFNPTTATKSQLGHAEGYYSLILPTYTQELSGLRSLGTPSSETAQYENVLGSEAGLIAAMTAARESALAGQVRVFDGAADLVARETTSLQNSATTFGFSVCGKPPAS